METQDEYYDLENRLRILQVMEEDQSKPPFDINAAWAEYGPWLSSQLDDRERAEAEGYASLFARLLYRGHRSINRIWTTIPPKATPPRSRTECQRYAQFTSAGMVYVCRNLLGATFGEVTQGMGSWLLAERDNIERRLERMERASQPVDLRLQKLLTQDAGALVDLYFGHYKEHRALSGREQEALMDEIEEAGAKGMLSAIYHVWIPPAAASLIPIFEQKMLPVFDPRDPSLDSLIALGSVMFPLLLDLIDDMVAEIAKPHSELREAVEDTIHGSISEACQQLVEVQERYNERYQSRRGDRHLMIIGFDPRYALYWDIALGAKKSEGTIKQVAERDRVEPKDVYNFIRWLKYNLNKLYNSTNLK